MNTILLLFRKDFKRYSWALIALAIVGLIEIYSNGTSIGIRDLKINDILQLLSSLLGGILFFVVIVMVVQEETLRDPDAYWLARPFNRLSILGAKLLFLLIILGIGLVAEVVTLILNGGFARISYAISGYLLIGLAIWQWQVFLAAQTRSLPRYLLLAVILVVGFYASTAVVFFLLPELDFEELAVLPAGIPRNLIVIIQASLWFAGGLGILVFFYLKRRLLAAWLLLIPLVIFSIMCQPKDSFFGISYSSDTNTTLTLEFIALEKSGTTHTGGTEYVSYRAYFEPPESDLDTWITPSWASLESDDRTIEVETNSASQKLEITTFEGRPAVSARVFSLERKDLEKIDDVVDLRLSYQLSFSTQTEIATFPIEQNASLAYEGSRILLSSFSETDEKLVLRFKAFVPEFAFEPEVNLGAYEPLGGRFSFGVIEKRSGVTLPSELFADWGGFSFSDGARLEVPLSNLSPEDLKLVFYAREITKTENDFLDADDIRLN